jgi:hypothetical protein
LAVVGSGALAEAAFQQNTFFAGGVFQTFAQDGDGHPPFPLFFIDICSEISSKLLIKYGGKGDI